MYKHKEYSQHFIVTINGIQHLTIVNHCYIPETYISTRPQLKNKQIKTKYIWSFREVGEGGLYHKTVDCNSSLGNFYPTYELTVWFTCLFIIHLILFVIHGFLSPHQDTPQFKKEM